ncbi:alpha/beta hydrolase family protein [Paenibacillus gansuensis]|uniref:Alpha/beta hydrolase family protein n=1 Tax=Paenibacillus gansuensis TaxID=306542 RepID=A0ABW5PE06_9BACL
MIYQLTYLSDTYKVKGYLCLPYGYDFPAAALQASLENYYQTGNLPVTEIAKSRLAEDGMLTDRKWPVLVYCRGGIGKVGAVKTAWLEDFSPHGHLIFAPCYRGNEGGEGRDEFGGADQEDVNSAIRFLRTLPFVDPARISVMGFSRGSINATQTAAGLQQIHKLVLWGGVSDLAVTYEERIDLRRMLKRVLGGTPSRKPEAYASRSPIRLVSRLACPVLVMHGSEDQQVDIGHSLRLYEKLKKEGLPCMFHRYEGYGHHLPAPIHKEAISRMFRWLEQNKKPAEG